MEEVHSSYLPSKYIQNQSGRRPLQHVSWRRLSRDRHPIRTRSKSQRKSSQYPWTSRPSEHISPYTSLEESVSDHIRRKPVLSPPSPPSLSIHITLTCMINTILLVTSEIIPPGRHNFSPPSPPSLSIHITFTGMLKTILLITSEIISPGKKGIIFFSIFICNIHLQVLADTWHGAMWSDSFEALTIEDSNM